jgi:hypothetical protein
MSGNETDQHLQREVREALHPGMSHVRQYRLTIRESTLGPNLKRKQNMQKPHQGTIH